MPYEMLWEARGLHRRYFGRTSDQEIFDSVIATESSARFDELRYILLDFLEVEEVAVSNPAFVKEIAAIDSAAALTNPHIKLAVVTAGPEIRKLAEAYAGQPLCAYPVEVFSSLAEARDWAKIPLSRDYRFRRSGRRG